MKLWRILAVLCMVVALVFTFAACGTAPAQTPTTEPTTEGTEGTEGTGDDLEKPTAEPETFKVFIGTWYADGSSASYRIVIEEDATWAFTNAKEEIILSGNLIVAEENAAINLYDPDGVQALDIKLEEEGKLYVEIYMENMMDTLSTNYFLNKITNDNTDSIVIDGDAEQVIGTEEAVDSSAPSEELVPNEAPSV